MTDRTDELWTLAVEWEGVRDRSAFAARPWLATHNPGLHYRAYTELVAQVLAEAAVAVTGP